MFYPLNKMQYQLDNLQYDIQILRQRNQQSPCISITGLRSLELYKTTRKCNKEIDMSSVILMLFSLLKIPTDWILFIGHPPRVRHKNTIPFEAYIYLTSDSIKLSVYRTLLNYLRKIKNPSVHVKIVGKFLKINTILIADVYG